MVVDRQVRIPLIIKSTHFKLISFSGLAAAAQLNKVGHAVVVYERKNRIGGLLRYGIPQMKLDKYVVDRRVKLMEDEGVRFITNTYIGKDVPANLLLKENDAIIVCTG